MKRFSLMITTLALLLLGVNATAADADKTALERAANGDHRSAKNVARNAYRHPVETLSWFGIRADMTVVEIWPGGGGWYTEVLAPFLRDKGTFYAANYFGPPDSYFAKNVKKFADKRAVRPNVYDKVQITELMPPERMTIAPADSADMVLTFRSLHNFIRDGSPDQLFAAMYTALKPGGILGVVSHRGNADMSGDEWAEKGYVTEARAIELAEGAGFELAARSEINANPNDTKDYEKGVWTLPPVLRLGDHDRARYAAIGESDRMTLKFRKPTD